MATALFPRTPRLDGTDPEAKRAEILRCFHATFDRYESLFGLLADDEAYYRKPISLRHPLIFYLGHTATFFINKLVLAGLVDKRLDPRLESMFAVGVDEMSWDDLDDARYDWPPVAAVWDYRRKVRETVDRVIRATPLVLPIGWDNPFWAVLMGIEHERIHLETSSVLMRQHALRYVRPQPDWQPCRDSGPAPGNALVDIPAGQVHLGRDFDDPYYGWDNEYGRHETEVPAFRAARYLVSNAEFLAFVEAGGYADDDLWDEEGLGWRRFVRAEHPTFWVPDGGGWRLRLLAEEVPMPWDWPVETNCHEARAFCRWKARETGLPVRLPSEDEWHRLYDHAGLADVPADAPAAANLHLDHWASSCPVTRFPHGELFDVVGNVWQWCETPTYPFDGFAVHPLYDDFTTPTFDGRHNMIKGGAWISAGNEARHVSRYAFRRHFFQHAGFRYVVSAAPVAQPGSLYETDALLAQYAEFHYGDEYFGVPNFPQAVARIALDAFARHHGGPAGRALDLGCATGRASFELARRFEAVEGVDFSARFIQTGVQLQDNGVLRYTLLDEGELVSYRERRLDALGLAGVARKVAFWQGDACNLKPVFTAYDLILAANLIDRLYAPRRFLAHVHQRLNPGGLLVLASPYTWLEEHTRREEWLGGFKKDGESHTTLDGLKDLLGERFDLVEGPRDVPFVIRETRRKFQHTLSELTVWRKRG
ncbi:5-histidylcysteine sulfoxide synthase [Pseudothauera rhizosphaerae]|uniref:5-histidylcysteine sulfoxide synthase n=1 Tax=Pseudothauera rhizosphaerae TaxID=2565932 RepID=A0A4S4AS22_9RHOO|nr:5-histidylcysteine sulfoxide synthase [Pseudothauera rhizosphaerae]THF62183.1 5-histidylcysteine sulfoxide synthase [Pseudothauera rhizosphaerae]